MENINEMDRKYLYDDDEISLSPNDVPVVLSRQSSKRYLR